MGCSISIHAKDGKNAKVMLAFLKEHYKPWHALTGQEGGYQALSDPTDDLSYDRKKNAIGFDFNPSGGWEKEYGYVVLRWMAAQVGLQKEFFKNAPKKPQICKTPVPYIVYDGSQHWPVFMIRKQEELEAFPTSTHWCVFDYLGLRWLPYKAVMSVLFDLDIPEDALVNANKHAGSPTDLDAWEDRRSQFLYEICKEQVDSTFQLIRTEMTRLDLLWKTV